MTNRLAASTSTLRRSSSWRVRLAVWWQRIPLLLPVGVVATSISAGGVLLLNSSDSRAQAVGPNLIADGLMVFLTVLLIDRLLETQRRRQLRERHLIVYKDLASIYMLTLSIWATLLFVASRVGEGRATEEELKDYEARYGSEPFSIDCLNMIRNVGSVLSVHPSKEKILASLGHRASEVLTQIEVAQRRHDAHLNSGLYLVLEELRISALIQWLGSGASYEVEALGRNILFSQEGRRKLSEMLHPARSDPRGVESLPPGRRYDIQDVIPKLGDYIDELADELLVNDAHYVLRTIDVSTGFVP